MFAVCSYFVKAAGKFLLYFYYIIEIVSVLNDISVGIIYVFKPAVRRRLKDSVFSVVSFSLMVQENTVDTVATIVLSVLLTIRSISGHPQCAAVGGSKPALY